MDAISPPSIKERPIIFSAADVRAILEGRKTQTRRILRPQPSAHINGDLSSAAVRALVDAAMRKFVDVSKCPYGQRGDRLWGRETFRPVLINISTAEKPNTFLDNAGREFRADFPLHLDGGGWKPSVHMPRWASRITLEIVSVRVERLQGISHNDAIAEGIERLTTLATIRSTPSARRRNGR